MCLFNISFSLLLRFTDDTFDPELAATIGKPTFKNLIEMPNIFLPSGCFSNSPLPSSHHLIASMSIEILFVLQCLTLVSLHFWSLFRSYQAKITHLSVVSWHFVNTGYYDYLQTQFLSCTVDCLWFSNIQLSEYLLYARHCPKRWGYNDE